ncbi:MAG: glucose-1-phosphate cytidylyltransferase, partial [Smithella sp.]|nr:glucose-1-phosphate cytidylyltransferase [Smithella sp.]
MKTVILAGGMGTRITEESVLKPKPMIEIGGKPIIWHIMKLYTQYGINEFIICLGYKGFVIKEYFANYYLHESDVTFDFSNKSEKLVHANTAEPWKVTLVNTGVDTMTGGRVKRIKDYVGDETFLLTYGDGLADINIANLIAFHKKNKKLATVTAVNPAGRFGLLDLDEKGNVSKFLEKPEGDGNWINGGFFVIEPEIFDYLEDDKTVLERKPLETLAVQGNLKAYRHEGFWYAMDTVRDKIYLEELW